MRADLWSPTTKVVAIFLPPVLRKKYTIAGCFPADICLLLGRKKKEMTLAGHSLGERVDHKAARWRGSKKP
jgi:hypothetical protein